MPPIRVFIVADDPLVRAGLAQLLDENPGFSVIGQSDAGGNLDATLDTFQPEVVLWDTGWEARYEPLMDSAIWDYPLVVLLPEGSNVLRVWSAGARGLLQREAEISKIEAALGAVVDRLAVLEPTMANTLAPKLEGISFEGGSLTPRELDVLGLMADGLTNRAIAHQLGLSEFTVKSHVNAILRKLGAQSRTDAAMRAARLGLISL